MIDFKKARRDVERNGTGAAIAALAQVIHEFALMEYLKPDDRCRIAEKYFGIKEQSID